MSARDRLFVALDVPTATAARELTTRIGDSVTHYKIGLELVFGGGLELAGELKSQGKHIFLDMKLLDIGNTVEKATANISARGLDFLTVHGHDRKTLDAAVKGRGASQLKLLAVTVLTSLTQDDLTQQGLAASPRELVLRRARMAAEAGFDGCVASGEEAAAIRAVVPKGFLIVTPGIRPAGNAAGDQALARPIWWSAVRSRRPTIRRTPHKPSSAKLRPLSAMRHGKREIERHGDGCDDAEAGDRPHPLRIEPAPQHGQHGDHDTQLDKVHDVAVVARVVIGHRRAVDPAR